MSLLAPIQGLGLKLKRYRITNYQLDLVNTTFNGNPLVVNDTSAVSTTATSYTQVKSYSISIPNNDFGRTVVNAIRVQINGYVSAGTGYVEVLIGGAAPTMVKTIVGSGNSNSFTNTSSALVFDGIISLSGVSSPYTLSIDAYNSTSGDTTYVADVYGFQGLAITSTTAVTVDQQETVNPLLDEIGITYDSIFGLHLAAYVVRNTTATATITGTDNFTPSGKTSATLSISADNDAANSPTWMLENDNNGNDSVPAGYNGSFTYTVQSYVGASGDVLLIGSLRAWIGFNTLYFPKGPHMGFVELTADVYGITQILACASSSGLEWTGDYLGSDEYLLNYSGGYTGGESVSGWFNVDDAVTFRNPYSGHLTPWNLLIEVIE